MEGEEEAWLPEEEVLVVNERVARGRKCKLVVDYTSERKDTFFSDVPDYTNFGRTRKGGNARPRSANKPVSACVCMC